MGVEAISMYGKEFDSFKEAVEFLYENNWMTLDEAEESIGWGEILCAKTELVFEEFNCDVSDAGVLGKHITAEDAYTSPGATCRIANEVEDVFGHADFFMFVQWC